MNVITLDMNISLTAACAEWDAIPDTDRVKKAAYWERYRQIRTETVDPAKPVTYPAAPGILGKEKPAPPTDRVQMIRNLAQKGKSAPVRPPAPISRQNPTPRPARCGNGTKPGGPNGIPPANCEPAGVTPPVVKSSAKPRTREGRPPSIDPAHTAQIHTRIIAAAAALGYGDLSSHPTGREKIHGASAEFQRRAKIPSAASFQDTVRSGRKIWPSVIRQIATGIGISEEWLLKGTGSMFNTASPQRFAPRPTVDERRNAILAQAAPELAGKYPPRKLLEPDAASWQPLIKRPPGGVLFDPIAFNVDQTFSIVGKKAFISRFAE